MELRIYQLIQIICHSMSLKLLNSFDLFYFTLHHFVTLFSISIGILTNLSILLRFNPRH